MLPIDTLTVPCALFMIPTMEALTTMQQQPASSGSGFFFVETYARRVVSILVTAFKKPYLITSERFEDVSCPLPHEMMDAICAAFNLNEQAALMALLCQFNSNVPLSTVTMYLDGFTKQDVDLVRCAFGFMEPQEKEAVFRGAQTTYEHTKQLGSLRPEEHGSGGQLQNFSARVEKVMV